MDLADEDFEGLGWDDIDQIEDWGTVIKADTDSASVPTPSKNQLRKDKRLESRQNKKHVKQRRGFDAAIGELRTFLAELPQVDGQLCQTCLPPDGNIAELSVAAGHAVRSAFNVLEPDYYQQLPPAHGPQSNAAVQALEGKVLIRPPKYDEKFLPQEYSLLHKVWALFNGDTEAAGIIDIGAGNANCALFAAVLLGVTVVCVERESPREELRAERCLPESMSSKVIRVERDIKDFGVEELTQCAKEHGLSRLVVVSKHLCGIGTDLAIDCSARLCESSSADSPQLLGVVMATCCTNKLCFDDFRTSRVEDFCSLYTPMDTPSVSSLILHRAVETISRCSAWRTNADSDGSAATSEQVSLAEAFEDAVQAMRLRRLGRIFGKAMQVRFAPRSCTLQDRCLVAGVDSDAVERACALDADTRFLELLNEAVVSFQCANDGKPIDVRPAGIVSERFGYDGRDPPDD